METLQIPNEVKEMLHYAEGKTLQEKLARLVVSDLESRLRSCAERLYGFDKKHGMAFDEFKKAWREDNVSEKYSYVVLGRIVILPINYGQLGCVMIMSFYYNYFILLYF